MIILIVNGHIIDPRNEMYGLGDIVIENWKIKEIRYRESKPGQGNPESEGDSFVQQFPESPEIIDASGLYVMPGLVDMHVHLREPGYEYKETIKSGTMAAVRGGFTSVCCMPDTKPVNDNETVTEFILRKAYAEGACYVYPIGAVTKGQEGRELAEMGMMREAGCVAFSDDGMPVKNSLIMRRALEYSRTFGAPVISHAEDIDLTACGVMNEGYLSTLLGLKGIPREAEVIMIKRDIDLALLTGGRLHIAHVSTEEGVNAIREAKRAGINVTAETCPHYFTITEDAVKDYNTDAKVNPPLRTEKDIAAIKEGLSDDTIDVIATDHAPHHRDEKLCEFDSAASGISGLETALPLGLKLVEEGVLDLSHLIRKMSLNPSDILGLDRGVLREGSDAALVIVDMDSEFEVEPEKFVSKGKNTPFKGMYLKGRPVVTICKGRIYDFRAERP
ncbi:dihydroorotase [bacterium BMS3Abin07]|nr:dihydroorotase [bacterium BMS3Abin07]GBE33321.1 dihydroorotase [bacterium BMS3Bbin05]HDL21307.1 dihydroorotase [Nitrospirota bacterium]HDO22226.1 dihydroorotase [Nitrospirota bacterium]HDZ88045.1 dihydroorotase [Nitrospirota bacterium]